MCKDIGQGVREVRSDTVEQQLVIQLPTQKTSVTLTKPGISVPFMGMIYSQVKALRGPLSIVLLTTVTNCQSFLIRLKVGQPRNLHLASEFCRWLCLYFSGVWCVIGCEVGQNRF